MIGLRRTGLEDERESGLNVRFRGIDAKDILTYLVSAYYSAAVALPNRRNAALRRLQCRAAVSVQWPARRPGRM